MVQLCEVRTRILLEKSADLQNRMAEIWALRKVVRAFEATLPRPEPIRPAVVAPLATVSDRFPNAKATTDRAQRQLRQPEAIRRLVELGLKAKSKS